MTDTDHLPDPHEDQHVAQLSPWVATQFLELLASYGHAMYTAGANAGRHPTCSDIARAHRTASLEIKQLMGVPTDHE